MLSILCARCILNFAGALWRSSEVQRSSETLEFSLVEPGSQTENTRASAPGLYPYRIHMLLKKQKSSSGCYTGTCIFHWVHEHCSVSPVLFVWPLTHWWIPSPSAPLFGYQKQWKLLSIVILRAPQLGQVLWASWSCSKHPCPSYCLSLCH